MSFEEFGEEEREFMGLQRYRERERERVMEEIKQKAESEKQRVCV